MHYKNGRPAKEGDRVVVVSGKHSSPVGVSGVIHTLNAGSQSCNARVTPQGINDPWVTVADCLHIDDIAAAEIQDSTKAPAVE